MSLASPSLLRDNMENSEYKLDIENRLTVVETHLNEIRENHLPHIETKIDRITWLLITTLAGLVVSLIIQLL